MTKALRLAAFLCLCATPFSQASNQTTPTAPASSDSTQTDQAQTPPPSAAPNSPKGFMLEDGTPVKLRTNRTVSSGDSRVGDTLDFEVLEDVQVKGVVVIPKGGLAFATVTEAQAKRRMARGGKLDINIDYAKLVDSEKAPLRAVKAVKGGGHTAAMTGGIVATSLVFFPAAPFFLFMHGKDISIPKGTPITAYVNGRYETGHSQVPGSVTAPDDAGSSSWQRTCAEYQRSCPRIRRQSSRCGAGQQCSRFRRSGPPASVIHAR